jgi:hypothetical protein
LEYVVKDMNCVGERDCAGSTESVITGCCEHGTSVVESGCCRGDRHLSGLLRPSSPDLITLLVALLLEAVVGGAKDMITACVITGLDVEFGCSNITDTGISIPTFCKKKIQYLKHIKYKPH